MARHSRSRGSRSTSSKIAIAIVVIAVAGTFTYFYYLQSLGTTPSGLLIDWRMKLTFYDARTGTNYTLPAFIGTTNGAWSNHTFDAFGPTGYSPMSTRDSSSTIWIQSNAPAVFNFGDFFNVWGEAYNESCVSYSTLGAIGMYCEAASEPVIYDSGNNGTYLPSRDVNVTTLISDLPVRYPVTGARLSYDPTIFFLSYKGNVTWNPSETIVQDNDKDGVYNNATDRIIYFGSNYQNLTKGISLSQDSKLKYYDWNGDGHWNSSVPPPVLSDGTNNRCLSRTANLSNGKDWLIVLWSGGTSGLYRQLTGNCIPPIT